MMDKPKNLLLLLHLLQVLFFAMLSAMPSYTHAATGTVTITNPSPIVVSPNSTFTVQGTYLLSSDTTPSGSSASACYFPPGTNIYFSGSYPGNLRPFNTGGSAFSRHNIHAYWSYKIDGGQPQKLNKLVTYTGPWNTGTDIGRAIPFSRTINTSGMALGSTHTATFFFEDVSSGNCSIGVFRSVTVSLPTTRVAEKAISFTIGYPNPPIISIALDKPSIAACEAETGTITVSSNDPRPNGGTVILTLPDGNTASAPFAGKTATFTFADFGLPNGYTGTHAPNDVLTFTADVTTAAGHSANAQATANVISGGLNVTTTPAKSIVEPKLQARSDVKVPQTQSAYTSPFEIYVTNSSGQPVTGANVSLNVETVDPTFAGHDHVGTLNLIKPTGTVNPSSGATLAGFFNAVYTTGEFSAIENITATASYQGCTGTAVSSNITTQLSGLSNLTVNSPHFKIGGTNAHHGNNWNGFPTTPDNNHWVSTNTATKMNIIMTEYPKKFGGAGLYINDASLPKGGRFDEKGNWLDPHQTHRRGIDIDMHTTDTGGVADVVKARLDFLNDKAGGKLFLKVVRERSPNHVHIQFYPN